MIVASMALLAVVSGTCAQEQERKLVDRILKPNMSLMNSAEKKQFVAPEISVSPRVQPKSFHPSNNSRAKSFATGRVVSPREFPAGNFRPRKATAVIPERSQVTKNDLVYIAHADGARVAPESSSNLAAPSFPGSRPYPGRGKNQKALTDRDTPLTIEQVRELLNKNK
jgi:hypothetical protein